MERLCEIFVTELNPGYVDAKYELARCVVEKVGRGQRLHDCEKSQFGGLPKGGEGMGRLCEIFLTELNPGYVDAKYELARCVV